MAQHDPRPQAQFVLFCFANNQVSMSTVSKSGRVSRKSQRWIEEFEDEGIIFPENEDADEGMSSDEESGAEEERDTSGEDDDEENEEEEEEDLSMAEIADESGNRIEDEGVPQATAGKLSL